MDANAIAHELVHQSIIANGDLTTISRTPDARQQNEILHACLLKTCDDTLQKNILPSAVDVLGEQFSQTAEVTFGFECDCGKVPHLATPVDAMGKSLICQSTQKRRNSLKKEQIWFSPVDNTEVRS